MKLPSELEQCLEHRWREGLPSHLPCRRRHQTFRFLRCLPLLLFLLFYSEFALQEGYILLERQ